MANAEGVTNRDDEVADPQLIRVCQRQRRQLFVEAVEQRADLRRGLLREALLEVVQRHQAVAVAVLVAGLAGGLHLGLPFGCRGFDGLGLRRRHVAPER